ncbi:MAG: hypothetical protein MUE85_17435 [Microscillaceae bacterium]|jgi:hypothetical protein|nr:hypothetical protein [Microscillaceae bacterium]
MIKLILLLAIFGLMMCNDSSKSVNWDDMTELIIYKTQEEKFDELSADEMAKIEFVKVNLAEAKQILQKAQLSNGKMYLWKGQFWAKASFANGETSLIRISRYGGFFYNDSNKSTYSFQDSAESSRWQSMISKTLGTGEIIR